MLYQRMLDKAQEPSEGDILIQLGNSSSLWFDIRSCLDQMYDFVPELVFYGKKYGWTIRYRKSGKTLCSLFPEKDAFTILVVLGKNEVGKVDSAIDQLNPNVRSIFENADQYHDGRWLWIRVFSNEDVESIKFLLTKKRKPKKTLTD